jgi:hypothetical protein
MLVSYYSAVWCQMSSVWASARQRGAVHRFKSATVMQDSTLGAGIGSIEQLCMQDSTLLHGACTFCCIVYLQLMKPPHWRSMVDMG